MAKTFLTSIDLGQNELQNARLQNLASAPASPVAGQVYFDTVSNAQYTWNGSAWIASDASKVANGAIPLAKLATDPLARANHTGTQTAATISDFDTQVRTNRLDQMAAPTASVALGGQKITGLADPTLAQDAATKNYVDVAVQSSAAGIDSKPSCRVASTANIASLSGTTTIDGVALVVGDRILVKNQSTGSQNGVYVVAAGVWSRAADADANGEITPGAFWFIEEGTANGGKQFICGNTGTITIGTTNIIINLFGAGTTYTASLGVQLVGNDFRAQAVASGGISIVAGGLQVDTAIVARKYSQSIGDGSSTSIAVTHNLNTQDCVANIRNASTNAVVDCDITHTSANVTTFAFNVAPSNNAYRVTILG
jgi:hypothetical protein